MYSGDGVFTTGRAVHSEALYIKLCRAKKWKNLYFFTQRDMCPGCEAHVQQWLKTQGGDAHILVLSAIETHVQHGAAIGGAHISGANIELYSVNNGWHLLNENKLDSTFWAQRAMFKCQFDECSAIARAQQKSVTRVRIPELGAHFNSAIQFYPCIVHVPNHWQVICKSNSPVKGPYVIPIVQDKYMQIITRSENTNEISSDFVESKFILSEQIPEVACNNIPDEVAPGLANLGSSCYFNATIQALFATDYFKKLQDVECNKDGGLCKHLDEIFKEMKQRKAHNVINKEAMQLFFDTTRKLFGNSIDHSFSMAKGKYEDASELLIKILDKIDREQATSIFKGADTHPFLIKELGKVESVRTIWDEATIKALAIGTLMHDLGVVCEYKIKCDGAGEIRQGQTERTTMLSLDLDGDIPFLDRVKTPESCLVDYRYEGRKELVKVTKTTEISAWPSNLLIIHLKRFIPTGRYNTNLEPEYRKEEKKIDYVETLTLQDKDTHVDKVYKLKSIINHYGSLERGHYTATILSNDVWYDQNDETTSKHKGREAYDGSFSVSENAYILIYECVSPA
jgi:ubiquitin C-terminal hydrolase